MELHIYIFSGTQSCETCKLPLGCVLNRLLMAQMMSKCDAESLLSTYNEFLRHLEGHSSERLVMMRCLRLCILLLRLVKK